jgi:hypothetical protein
VFDRTKDVFTLETVGRFSPQYLENRLKFSPYLKDSGSSAIADYIAAVLCIDYSWWASGPMNQAELYQLHGTFPKTEVLNMVKSRFESPTRICRSGTS